MAFWTTLTGDNIKLLDTEKTIMESIVTMQDLDQCVRWASDFVRGYVEGGGNAMEPAPAVPPEVIDDVLAIARYTYLAQEPTGTLLTAVRQKEYDNAMAHLRDIAKEVSAVTQGDIPPTTNQFGKFGSETKIIMRTSTTA
jgi:hypothetical protein